MSSSSFCHTAVSIPTCVSVQILLCPVHEDPKRPPQGDQPIEMQKRGLLCAQYKLAGTSDGMGAVQ